MAIMFDSVQIGPVKDGRRMVTLPSVNKGAYIQCEAPVEEVDQYMSNRKEVEKQAGIKEALSFGIATIVGAACAAVSKMEGKLLEKSVLGAACGVLVGMIGALGFMQQAQNKIQKLNDEFIAQNNK